MRYRMPPETEDHVVEMTHSTNLDPALQSPEETTVSYGNLRLFPPPVFSRQGIPQNYLYVHSALLCLLLTSCSFKTNPASIVSTIIDEETGEEKKRLVNRMRWKGYGPASIQFTDPLVSIFISLLYQGLVSNFRSQKALHRASRRPALLQTSGCSRCFRRFGFCFALAIIAYFRLSICPSDQSGRACLC
jgi:hypothetical protein